MNLPAKKGENSEFVQRMSDRNLYGFSKEINFVCGDFNFVKNDIDYSHVGINFDHKLVSFMVSSQVSAQEHGFGFSKLNLQVFENDSFIEYCFRMFERFVNTYVRVPAISLGLFSEWDILKRKILVMGIEISKMKNREEIIEKKI